MDSMTIAYKNAASIDSSAVSSSVGPIKSEYLKIINTVPVFPFMQSQLAASTNVDKKSLEKEIILNTCIRLWLLDVTRYLRCVKHVLRHATIELPITKHIQHSYFLAIPIGQDRPALCTKVSPDLCAWLNPPCLTHA